MSDAADRSRVVDMGALFTVVPVDQPLASPSYSSSRNGSSATPSASLANELPMMNSAFLEQCMTPTASLAGDGPDSTTNAHRSTSALSGLDSLGACSSKSARSPIESRDSNPSLVPIRIHKRSSKEPLLPSLRSNSLIAAADGEAFSQILKERRRSSSKVSSTSRVLEGSQRGHNEPPTSTTVSVGDRQTLSLSSESEASAINSPLLQAIGKPPFSATSGSGDLPAHGPHDGNIPDADPAPSVASPHRGIGGEPQPVGFGTMLQQQRYAGVSTNRATGVAPSSSMPSS